MEQKIAFDDLDTFFYTINNRTTSWVTQVNEVENKVQKIIDSSSFSGETANNIKGYMQNHLDICHCLYQLINLHASNCLLYKNDYQSHIDSDLHAVLVPNELSEIQNKLISQRNTASSIGEDVNYIINRIRDVVYINNPNISETEHYHNDGINYLSNLQSDIQNIEDNHVNKNFINTGEMRDSLWYLIEELMTGNRHLKTEYAPHKLSSVNSDKINESYSAIKKELNDKISDIKTASANSDDRQVKIEEEIEERQAVAFGINAVVIVACVAVTIATCGAAAPATMAMAGLVMGATTGAVIGATTNLTGQYVKNGNLIENSDKIDWNSFGEDVVKGSIEGAITGCISGAAQSFQLTKLNNVFNGVANYGARIGGQFIIGGTVDVTAGVATRFFYGLAESAIDSKVDVGYALNEAFDLGEIGYDFVVGGGTSAVGEAINLKRYQKQIDNKALEYNAKYNPVARGEEAGWIGIKSTQNGTADFSDTSAIFKADNGEIVQFKFNPTGDYKLDNELLAKYAKDNYGIDVKGYMDPNLGDSMYAWNRLDDFDVGNNSATVQLVKNEALMDVGPRSGSVSQYSFYNGKGYGKQTEIVKIKEADMDKFKELIDGYKELKEFDKEIESMVFPILSR